LIGSILQGIPVHHWHNVASGDQTAVVSLWVGVASLIIAIAGLIVTLAMLPKWWRARTERKAAELAERETEFRVPEIKCIVTKLDAAIVADDPRLIRRLLEEWRTVAAAVYGLLLDAKSDAVLRCMFTSMSLAREASNALLRGESARSACIDAQDAIAHARDALITWVSRKSRRARRH